MTPSPKKLKKLQRLKNVVLSKNPVEILKIIDEIEENYDLLKEDVASLKESNDEVYKLIEELKHLRAKTPSVDYSRIIAQVTRNIRVPEAVVDYKKIVADILALIPTPKDGNDAVVDYDLIIAEVTKQVQITDNEKKELENRIIDEFEADLPKLGTAIRDGLELLQDDERLDVTAIKGMDEKLKAFINSQPPTTPTYVGNASNELQYLNDVRITSPSNGQVLKYNSTTRQWENGTDSGGIGFSDLTGTSPIVYNGAGNFSFSFSTSNNWTGFNSFDQVSVTYIESATGGYFEGTLDVNGDFNNTSGLATIQDLLAVSRLRAPFLTTYRVPFTGSDGFTDDSEFTFDSTIDKLYLSSSNTSTYKANPTMTANNAPSPFVVSASTEANSSNAAWNAFDNDPGQKWAASTSTGWLKIDMSQVEVIKAYSVQACIAGQETFAPKTWTFEGSNDNSTWTILNSQSNVSSWTALETRTYTLSSPARYRYYRINVSANQGGSLVTIVEFKLYHYTTVSFTRDSSAGIIEADGAQVKLSTISDTYGSAKLFLTDKRKDTTGFIVSTDTSELVLEQTGDVFGTSQLILRSRNGANGALFRSVSLDLVDFGFLTSTGTQSNLRFEHRAIGLVDSNNSSGEFQFLDQATGSATKVFAVGLSSTLLTAGKLWFSDGVNIKTSTTTGTKIGTATTEKIGFWNATPVVQPTVTGSRGGNAALASLLTQLATIGLIVDSTT